MSHIHPTPLHIRGCVGDEMWKAAKAWERETGQVAPYSLFSKAFRDGIARAIREHEAEVAAFGPHYLEPQLGIAAE